MCVCCSPTHANIHLYRYIVYDIVVHMYILGYADA